MTECIICLDDIGDEYAIIHNVNEVNKLHPECVQKWTEHSLIGIMTRDLIINYSVFKNDRYVKTVCVDKDQERTLVQDQHLTFREIWDKIFDDDVSFEDVEEDSDNEIIEIEDDLINFFCCL